MVTINCMVTIVDGCVGGFMTIVYTKEKERKIRRKTLYHTYM